MKWSQLCFNSLLDRHEITTIMWNYDYNREKTKGKKKGSFSCHFKDQNVEGVLTGALSYVCVAHYIIRG